MGARIRPATITGAISVMTVASVAFIGWGWLTGSTVTAADTTATMDGLSIDIEGTQWAPMDHLEDDQSGFLMPDQMMPGAPTGGAVRIGIDFTLTNTSSVTREFSLPDDFTMVGGLQSEPLPLGADTVGDLGRLSAGATINGILYFDLNGPEAEGEELPPLYLEWTQGRDSVRVPVPLPGDEAPEHNH